MNIIELAKEAFANTSFEDKNEYLFAWSIPVLERFANAVIAARDAELIAGVGETSGSVFLCDACGTAIGDSGYCPKCGHDSATEKPVYSKEQVAGAVAKKDAEIAGWKADQKENMQIQVDQHQRIATLESALKRANSNHEEFERKWYLEMDRVEQLESVLKVALEALETCEVDGDAVGADGGQSFDDDKVTEAIEKCKEVLHD